MIVSRKSSKFTLSVATLSQLVTELFCEYMTFVLIGYLVSSTAGGTYVRWGRKDCPGNDTELVYSGKLELMSNLFPL